MIQTSQPDKMTRRGNSKRDWLFRYFKGIVIGSGFILPGVSGGALAAVFGVYERIISFLAHVTLDFKENLLYLLPLGLGGMTGVFFLSFGVSFVLDVYETQILWFFVGCILGTLPALWEDAGKQGRQRRHYAMLIVAFIIGLMILSYGYKLFDGGVPQNIFTWAIAGALIGLGVILPGLSPSNFLVYMGMYKDMADGIKRLDFFVIIPIGLGALLTVLLFSKVMDYILGQAYTGLFHLIIGVVLASTVMIVPLEYDYMSTGTIACVALCAAGMALGYWMCSLDKKYK